ncbi:hypothetical protein P1059_01851 [Pasteurella multocida subsp. gallicida P1059]|nr:hypothetical protein P1059_01851 [Pasteurella multocida subsp. gallicida P1059]
MLFFLMDKKTPLLYLLVVFFYLIYCASMGSFVDIFNSK